MRKILDKIYKVFFSISIAAVTFALQYILSPALGSFVWLLIFPAILLSSLLYRLRGAILTMLVFTILVLYSNLIPPQNLISSKPVFYISLSLFVILGLFYAFTQNDFLKSAETALHDSELKYKRIVETALEGIIIISPDGVFQYVNQRFADMIGYPEEEILGRRSDKFIREDEIPDLQRSLEELKRGCNVQSVIRFITKDDNVIWTLYNATPIFDDKGMHQGNLSTHMDITGRKMLEDELTRREQIYNRMVNNLPKSLVHILDSEFRFIESGGSLMPIIGLKNETIKGRKIAEVFSPDILVTLEPCCKMAMTGQEASCETPFRDFTLSNIIVPLNDQSGKTVNLLILSTDISEQKKSGEELKKAKEKLELALENANIGMWELDLDTHRMTCDSRMDKMLNISYVRIHDEQIDIEDNINEEDIPQFREAVVNSLKSSGTFETILRTREHNGESRYISMRGLVNYNDGKPLSLAGVCFDVTGMKKGNEKLLIEINEQLTRSNRDLQQFAYVASHDLQEPLRMVSSYTQMLEYRYGEKLDNDAREFIKYAVDGSRRMYNLINGLLDYSRLQSRKRIFEKVRMNDVLQKVIKNLEIKIMESKAVISYRHLPVIYADENQMIQLLQNLIENALKFTTEIPHVTVSARSQEENHLFSVRDKGTGIDPQYFERIFKIFQRLSRNFEGTGVGLAICKRIVETHGGRIWVESQPGGGSDFLFTIPKTSMHRDKKEKNYLW
jgi:PAS domain S-box-containing protein